MNSWSRPSTWEAVPDDPDPVSDLGCDGITLDLINQSDGERAHVLVLPRDDRLLREEAFIIANVDAVVDLVTMT